MWGKTDRTDTEDKAGVRDRFSPEGRGPAGDKTDRVLAWGTGEKLDRALAGGKRRREETAQDRAPVWGIRRTEGEDGDSFEALDTSGMENRGASECGDRVSFLDRALELFCSVSSEHSFLRS